MVWLCLLYEASAVSAKRGRARESRVSLNSASRTAHVFKPVIQPPAKITDDLNSSMIDSPSLSAITAYGHAGIYLRPQWQLMGALEALNGLILFGLTTAFLFTVISRSGRTSRTEGEPKLWRLPYWKSMRSKVKGKRGFPDVMCQETASIPPSIQTDPLLTRSVRIRQHGQRPLLPFLRLVRLLVMVRLDSQVLGHVVVVLQFG